MIITAKFEVEAEDNAESIENLSLTKLEKRV